MTLRTCSSESPAWSAQRNTNIECASVVPYGQSLANSTWPGGIIAITARTSAGLHHDRSK
jgi:hypothetical protein